MDSEQERRDFEAAMSRAGYRLNPPRYRDGPYRWSEYNAGWEMWQAARRTHSHAVAPARAVEALREAYASAASLPEHINRIVAVFGSLRKMAEALDIDVGYLSRLRSGEKTDPSDEVLRVLGLRKTVIYARAYAGTYAASLLIQRTKSG